MLHLDRRMTALQLRLQAWSRTHLHRASAETGEGVISAAIVVLIMAIIGAAMWAAFNGVWQQAETTIVDSVNEIG
jgi:hypothetical protein